MNEYVLQMRGISKYFGSVVANSQVNFSLKKGVVHGLLGENGAGKTTLMNILFGLHKADEGSIEIQGKEVVIHSPSEARMLGIGMVHQHFMLVPTMTVTENIMLGLKLPKYPLLNRSIVRERILYLSKQFNLDVNPEALVSQLSVGQQQRVEIINALYSDTTILILDEPTAVLTPDESRELASILRTLKTHGTSIVLISHKLEEILEIADEVTVLRGGKHAGYALIEKGHTSKKELCCMMVGRDVCFDFTKKENNSDTTVLELSSVCAQGDRHVRALHNISFSLKAGEILAIAGVDGNGQKELCEVLTRIRDVSSGNIYLHGEDITTITPKECINKKVSYIPEDRMRSGLVMNWDIGKNLILKSFYHPPFVIHGLLSTKEIESFATSSVSQFSIKTESIHTRVKNLSGGNQQKVILARELAQNPSLLIASHPTRGLDVGAMEFVRSLLMKKREAQVAILLISADLDEIFQTADRIMVMYNGSIMGIVSPTVGIEKVGQMMAGITEEALS